MPDSSAVTPPPERIRLVVLFGGRSAEHDVSRVSASHVMRAIDPERYDVVPVGITRDGTWQLAEDAAELLSTGRCGELPESIDVTGPGTEPMSLVGGADTVVIPVLHGPNGEDGTVQGLLEMAGLPYVGAGVLGSAVAMDKAMSKTVLDAHGIAQPRWRQVLRSDLSEPGLAERLLEELGPVVFVKPANMGSSIGVSRATDVDGVLAAFEDAARYDERFVVEQGVGSRSRPPRELECGVIGNLSPRASVVG